MRDWTEVSFPGRAKRPPNCRGAAARAARIPVKNTGGSSYNRLKNTGGSQDTHGTHGAHGTDDARRFGSSGVPSNWAPWGIQSV